MRGKPNEKINQYTKETTTGQKDTTEKIQGKERLCVKPHTEKLKRKRNVTPKSVTRNRKCK